MRVKKHSLGARAKGQLIDKWIAFVFGRLVAARRSSFSPRHCCRAVRPLLWRPGPLVIYSIAVLCHFVREIRRADSRLLPVRPETIAGAGCELQSTGGEHEPFDDHEI
nr:hypothetical protein CFP56_03806 [Quercus suber]